MLRASAIASICHVLPVGHRVHCKSICQTWEIALPLPTDQSICSIQQRGNKYKWLQDTGGDPQGYHFCRQTQPFPYLPKSCISYARSAVPLRGCHVRAWAPATRSSLLFTCAVPAATTLQQWLDAFTSGTVLRPCVENISCQLPPSGLQALPVPQQGHALWFFWEDVYSSCSVHVLVWKAGEQEEGLDHRSASKIRSQCGVRWDICSWGRK